MKQGNRDEWRGVGDVTEIGWTWGWKRYSGGKAEQNMLRNNHDMSHVCHSCTSLSFYHIHPPVTAYITHVPILIKGRLWSVHNRSHQIPPGPGIPTHSQGEGSSNLFSHIWLPSLVPSFHIWPIPISHRTSALFHISFALHTHLIISPWSPLRTSW